MLKNSIFFGLILLLLPLLYSGCEDNNTIGFPTKEIKVRTVFVDTFTLKTSTILLDSIASSGTGRVLVGEYHDNTFGKTTSSSFFQIASDNAITWAPTSKAIFDSLMLILKYDKYFYGDTTQVQQLTVNELSQDLTNRTISSYTYDGGPPPFFFTLAGLYNHSKTNVFPSSLGTLAYKPKPLTGDSIAIRLQDQKGKDWFNLARDLNYAALSSTYFLQAFKGIKVTNATSVNGAVIGFVSSTAKIRVYYSEPDVSGTLQKKYFDFGLYNSTLQYNQINYDRSGTPLQNLVHQKAIPSDQTNNETYIQGGTGILTKVQFPSFQYLNSNGEKFIVLSARLVVNPVNPFNDKIRMPPTLALFAVDNNNNPTAAVSSDFSQTPQSATLVQDKELNRVTQYAFSITQYMDALLNKKTTASSITIGLPAAAFETSVNQLRIGNGKNQTSKIKLEIYLSRLNN